MSIIQFRPKASCVSMCPSDWATPYSPTYEELSRTLKSLDDCYLDTERQLASAGVQTEFILRNRLTELAQMRGLLWNYYKEE